MSLATAALDRLAGHRISHGDFRRRFDRFLQTGQNEPGDGEALLKAFLRSGGSWLSEVSALTTERGPIYDFGQAQDTLALWSQSGSFDRALADLRRDGYTLLDVGLTDAMVTELSEAFAQAPCTLTSDQPTDLALGQTVTVDFERPLAEKYAITTSTLLNLPLVRALLLDRGLLDIAQAYLGSAPIVDIVTSWYSFPSNAPSHEAAQLFHFDLDRVRWLKAFFLLTDQDVETGAHIYVPGTHRDGGIDAQLLKRGYARLEDDVVAEFHPRGEWKTMEGLRGVILLEDTRGLHKGLPLVRDHRLMLQFEYAQSMFGHPASLGVADIDPIVDGYWSHMQETYPKVFDVMRRP